MSIILCIETSSKNCSVAIVKEGKNLDYIDNVSEEYSHSEKLTQIIDNLLKKNKIILQDLCAVAISSGPGSYTGLRIGCSAAKGLCYSLDIPLISVPTLLSMYYGVENNLRDVLYCPMIDARRMEVYTAIYDNDLNYIMRPQPLILKPNSFDSYLKNKICFFGNGAIKFQDIVKNTNASFIIDLYPSAKFFYNLVYDKYQKKDFEDLAYYEPNYLKDFYFNN